MAEPHDQSAAADRYAAIEAAYCDDRWQDVLTQGRQLLKDLGPADDALATALRQRLHLLMAHTHLHGLGDRDTAEDLYRQVLNTANAEPALRRSAEEGLQQCDQPTVRPAAETSEVHPPLAAPPPAAAPSPERPLPEPVAPPLTMDRTVPLQAPATPWLEATPDPAAAVPAENTAPALLADVVEEPELLDVHRADPLRAEEIELELREPPSAAAAAAQALAASATVEAIAEVTAGLTGGRTGTDPSPGEPGPAVPEVTAVAESLQAEPAIAEPPPVPLMEEEDDDPDLLEGLLQVALG